MHVVLSGSSSPRKAWAVRSDDFMHSKRTANSTEILVQVRNRAWTGFEVVLGGSTEALGESLRRLWGGSGEALGKLWGSFGKLWGDSGKLWGDFGKLWGDFGKLWGALAKLRGGSGASFGGRAGVRADGVWCVVCSGVGCVV